MKGMGRAYKRGKVYWIEYWHRNKQYRESARSTRKSDAEHLLKQRLGEIGQGKLIGPKEGKMTFEQLAEDLVRDYIIKGNRSVAWAKRRIRHLERFFGMDHALDITTARIRAYIQYRFEEKAANATINRELAALSRMFTLTVQAGILSKRPYIPRLEEAQPRQGFMEHPEYVAIREHLPAHCQDVLNFGYYSGWRRGEICKLEWHDVDVRAGVIRLQPELSKNKAGRVLVLSGELKQLIQKRWEARILGCPYVFHRHGKQIKDMRGSWYKACRLAGLEGKLFHDLRRTTVRNLVRAGIPDRVAMSVTGHKTRSVFDRYNIVSEADLQQATERLDDYLSKQSATPTVIPLQKKFVLEPAQFPHSEAFCCAGHYL